jgi:hypothetical protein
MEARATVLSVTDAVADVLTELGYEVGPDFSVGEAAAGRLEVARPGEPGHLVRLRVDEARKLLTAQVYRTAGDADPAADTAATAAWCGALDAAIARLAGAGVVLTPQLRTEPGRRPTPALTGEGHEERRARETHRTRERTER